ncbi:MAG: hypothetical protein LBK95_18240, partial [Bifidobacteriaceae bacterium]|nr:hypothetical protein [Bifidobacteriaceae bacterium]
MDARNEFGKAGEQALRAPLPGAAPAGPAAGVPARYEDAARLEDPSTDGAGTSIRGLLDTAEDELMGSAGTSIQGLLDAAQEETRLARTHQARAARLAAQAAR